MQVQEVTKIALSDWGKIIAAAVAAISMWVSLNSRMAVQEATIQQLVGTQRQLAITQDKLADQQSELMKNQALITGMIRGKQALQ